MGPFSLVSEENQEFHGPVVVGAEPVGHPRVELGRLARRENGGPVAEHEAEPAGEHVDPFEALVGLQVRFDAGPSGRQPSPREIPRAASRTAGIRAGTRAPEYGTTTDTAAATVPAGPWTGAATDRASSVT